MSDLPVLEPREAYALWAATYPPYAHNPLMRTEERAMLSLLPDGLRGCNVLDAGCGSGRYIAHALQRGAALVIGLDLSAEMLQRARREVLATSENVRLIQAGLDTIPLPDAWADVTLCGLTIGHLPDLARPLKELRRVTKPGGVLLCSDFHPIGKSLGWQRDFKAGERRYAVRYTAHSVTVWLSACNEVGWNIREILEPRLETADIPRGAVFDPAGLGAPVALVLELR